MLDFMKVATRLTKSGTTEIYPKFIINNKTSDLMIRGGDFYAIWVEERGLWSTDEQDAIDLIDKELTEFAKKYEGARVLHMWDAETGMVDIWHKYCQRQMRDSFRMLDEKLMFSNSETKKSDYASKKLPYPLEEGECPAYDKIISTLYSEDERAKIEWAIGAIVTGDSKKIQKFMVLYGEAGTGKSTILNIIQQLFEGYYSVFDAKALGSSSNAFALEAFKSNPLVAIQHDGDLSRIEDNTRLNSLVSHELMTVNEKFKPTYPNQFKCFLFMGTNKPVKITDAKSGLIRRLIDVSPSGNKLSQREYSRATKQVAFELGAIAHHCKEVYLSNPGKYDSYIPVTMLGASNDFYNFVIDSYHVFKKEDGTTLKAAWEMYKTYCEEAKVSFPFSQRNFKEELKTYFKDFKERFISEDGTRLRSYYTGFRTEKFETEKNPEEENGENKADWLVLSESKGRNILDEYLADYPAQYASSKETPLKSWDEVKTKLSDIDTSKLHYSLGPESLITVDFDVKDENGNKSFEKNVEAASKWPPTYAELSKGGQGIHLEYIYAGDVSKLSRVYDNHIEIKVFTGKSSLRRKLTKCNDLPIATISSGLPLKGEKSMISKEVVQTERGIRTLIKRNINKEYHPATKPSIDFIFKILDDAYKDGVNYDVSDMKNAVIAFAANSTNQADYCLKLVNQMKFKSEEPAAPVSNDEASLVFYDVEVFPNLFLVNWKVAGKDKPVVRMINPKPSDIEELLHFKLIGFNCRRYDNHMLYARLMGYDNERLYNLSQKIVNSKKGENRDSFFGEAYNISYTDVYDFAAKKQSLKKWEIELGIRHQELGLPWDQPVPEEKWEQVAEYCDNDVIATEAVFNHLKGDWTARQILAEIAGMTVNDTTNSLTTRIIFGKEKKPALVYTDLATGERTDGTRDIVSFPEYKFEDGKNMYRGTDVGYGGYVYAEPGMYKNVALLDVASMHPNSAINLNAFGEYTKHFKDILDARIAIKHGDFEAAKQMFGGRLAPYLNDKDSAAALAQALKIAINSVYGLTSANFANPFRDIRNKNNIVALRGALFMRTLQDEVQKRGFTVAHIKTDSIKIPDATPDIIQFVMDFGKKYGYTFEHEATYDRMCLVNNAVYIAKYKGGKHDGEWTATGKQFAVPYVFKTLFSKEPINMNDVCETFSVKSALYLDMNEKLPDVSELEKQLDKIISMAKKSGIELDISGNSGDAELDPLVKQIAEGHDYHFIGKVGEFCPVKPGKGGGILCREQNGKYYAATGTTGYRWLETEVLMKTIEGTVSVIDEETGETKEIAKKEMAMDIGDIIDLSYYRRLVDDAVEAISQYGDFERFVSDEPVIQIDDQLPWLMACGRETCVGCKNFICTETDMKCKLNYDISDLKAINTPINI